MKLVPNTRCHVPDEEKTDWLERLSIENGMPVYQRDRLDAALSCCRGQRRAIDGGAHVGLMTLPLAAEFDHVVAFEPVPELFECLRTNTHGNCRVTIHPEAVGLEPGYVYLVGTSRKSVAWHVPLPGEVVPDKFTTVQAFVRPIDELGLADVDLIKLDVEGHELAALRGAECTIRRSWPVIVIEEKHDPQARATAWLESLKYRVVKRLKHDLILMR